MNVTKENFKKERAAVLTSRGWAGWGFFVMRNEKAPRYCGKALPVDGLSVG